MQGGGASDLDGGLGVPQTPAWGWHSSFLSGRPLQFMPSLPAGLNSVFGRNLLHCLNLAGAPTRKKLSRGRAARGGQHLGLLWPQSRVKLGAEEALGLQDALRATGSISAFRKSGATCALGFWPWSCPPLRIWTWQLCLAHGPCLLPSLAWHTGPACSASVSRMLWSSLWDLHTSGSDGPPKADLLDLRLVCRTTELPLLF